MAQLAAGNEVVVFGTSQRHGASPSKCLSPVLPTPASGSRCLIVLYVDRQSQPTVAFARVLASPYPQLGFTLSGATPAPTPTVDCVTTASTTPSQIPAECLRDANAIAGHPFSYLRVDCVAARSCLGRGSTGERRRILLLSQDLCCCWSRCVLSPLGNPLADLMARLTVLVELGYDRTAHQDVPARSDISGRRWVRWPRTCSKSAVQGVNDASVRTGCRRRGSRRYRLFSGPQTVQRMG